MKQKLIREKTLSILHTYLTKIKSISNRTRAYLLLLLIILSWGLTQLVRIHASSQDKLQEGIAEKIIRFHVIANSDSEDDQHLKYKVKNALVQFLQPYLNNASDIEDAHSILDEMLPMIEDIAIMVIDENGYDYSVTTSLTSAYFPMKVYGDYTFPPGNYQALQIKIGRGSGRNWWCVMFPPLCFIDETYSIINKNGEKKLKYLLTEEEYKEIENNKIPVKIKFKLFDSLKRLFSN